VAERKLPSQWEGLGGGIKEFSFSHSYEKTNIKLQ
jgi:hypothetical protein